MVCLDRGLPARRNILRFRLPDELANDLSHRTVEGVRPPLLRWRRHLVQPQPKRPMVIARRTRPESGPSHRPAGREVLSAHLTHLVPDPGPETDPMGHRGILNLLESFGF